MNSKENEDQKPMTNRTNKKLSSKQTIHGVPIAGIGASAGGLEAFKVLFESLAPNTGLSFVVIQHLATGQESMLTDILSRFTKMQVQTAKDKMPVEADHVYVIPPGKTLTINNRVLTLNSKDKSLKPIDTFFVSLAEDLKNQSIGIVLSGTGSDGTEGLKIIKAQGGITFAQTPSSAQYPDMPQNAISADATEFVLNPDQIAQEIQKIANNPQLVRSQIESKTETGPRRDKTKKDTGLNAIFTLLKTSFGVDFSHYKETVVNRRIKRRVLINHVEGIEQYIDYLRKHPNELQALYNDMLIGVTNFFREPETFSALKETVFPELSENRVLKEPIRVWIPGCSTGEEVYSFAIAIQEYIEDKSKADFQFQIFGTDVNEKNIEKARQGIYLKTIETDVSENRLKRFFVHSNGNYQIKKNLRDMCVFAKQDITADPPFSNMDIVSCRNMLIYFDEHLHEKVVPILHYAIKLGGFLVLGSSESIGKFTNLFEPITKRGIIYRKKKAQPSITFGLQTSSSYLKSIPKKGVEKQDILAILKNEVDHRLVTEYVPATMLVNATLDVLLFRGNVAPFVLPESGYASLNLAKVVRKELRSEVQTAIFRAKKEDLPVKENAVRFVYSGEQKTINIQIVPLRIVQYEEPFFLILFEDVSSAAALLRQSMALGSTPEGRESIKDTQNRNLREELESTKESLQRIIETQEATNEELRTTMEEAQSSNEELQSTNEELETAKEELQSSNEELKTLNDEVKNRNEALGQLNDDLANLNKNVDPAIIIVDKNFKVRLFSPSAQKVLNLSPSVVGVPITNIKLSVEVEDLKECLSEVTTKLSGITREVKNEQGHFYEMRIRPYITQEDKIDGAVLSFVDVDNRKKLEEAQRLAAIATEHEEAEEKLRQSEEEYRSLFTNMMDGFVFCQMIFDKNGKPIDFVSLKINDAFERITGLKREVVVGRKVTEVIPGLKAANPELFEICGRVAQTCVKERFEIFVKPFSMWLSISAYCPRKGFLAAIFEDITQRKKAEEQRKRLNDELEERVQQRTVQVTTERQRLYNVLETLPAYVILLDKDYHMPFSNKVFRERFGESHGRRCYEYLFNKDHECENCETYKVYKENKPQHWYWKGPDGRDYDIYDFPFKEADGSTLILEMGIDITDQKKMENQLKDSERLAAIGATAGMVGHDIRNPLQAMASDVYLAKSDLSLIPEGKVKESLKESLDGIDQNVDYINKIVQDLQDYARPLNPKLEESDLKSIVDAIVMKNGLPKNIRVKVKISDEAKMIRADSYYLSRILFNLITNAVQAMPQGGKLTIAAYKDGEDVVLSVQDTGVGIPKNIQDKMFRLMFTTKSKGQGFGLPVVKRMAKSLGGEVTFESQEGKGTTFLVRLPHSMQS